jgi:hypothetical protein
MGQQKHTCRFAHYLSLQPEAAEHPAPPGDDKRESTWAQYTRQTNGLRSISLDAEGAGHSTHLVWGGSLPRLGQVLLDIIQHVYQLTKRKKLLQPLCKSSPASTASRLAGSSVSAGDCQEKDRCIGVALASDGSVQIVQVQAESNL